MNWGWNQVSYAVLKAHLFLGIWKQWSSYRDESTTGNHQKYFQITRDPTSHTRMCICNWGWGGQGLRRETGMLMLRRGLKKWLWLFCFILLISSYFFKCKTQAFEDTHKHIPHTHAHAHAYLPPALSLPLLSHTEKFLLSWSWMDLWTWIRFIGDNNKTHFPPWLHYLHL